MNGAHFFLFVAYSIRLFAKKKAVNNRQKIYCEELLTFNIVVSAVFISINSKTTFQTTRNLIIILSINLKSGSIFKCALPSRF